MDIAGITERFCRKADWNDITGLGAGSSYCLLSEVKTVADAVERIRIFQQAGLKIQMIGGGMNFIGSDAPLTDTVFMKLLPGGAFSILKKLDGRKIYAGAACSPGEIVRFALKYGLGGAAGLSGIPGTLGGALAMNAGAQGVCFADLVLEVKMTHYIMNI